MTRFLLLGLLLGVVAGPSAAIAQTRERVKISNIRLGLPNGPYADSSRRGMYKTGAWAPVYADLECVRDTEEALRLTAETLDADDIMTQGGVDIAPMTTGERRGAAELGRVPYLKASSMYTSVTVRVTGAESGRNYGESGARGSSGSEALNAGSYLIVAVGGSLNSLRLPSADAAAADAATAKELRNGWVSTSQITDPGLLPDHWIGYAAADVMVLQTGADRAFWEVLAAPQHDRRRRAIAEWVRRGGRLIVGLGTNVDAFVNLKEFADLLPATVPAAGKTNVNILEMKWQGARQNLNATLSYPNGKDAFASAILEPKADRAAKTILTELVAKDIRPLAVQGGYGMGRVTVFAFDLDRSPFTDMLNRGPFWENVLSLGGYQLPDAGVPLQTYNRDYDEYTGAMQGSLDFFEGVPVVSFGWVALFILLYIVLIGPVDYFFLKKVVKRLEWTWVTFPVIVIGVSTAAYFTAYAIKGHDLKTNKTDVVDYDLNTGRVDGHTWFTLFSPRIQKYTVGIEPAVGDASAADPAWAVGKSPDAAFNSVLSWHAPADNRRNMGGGGGLLTKKYEFPTATDPSDPNRELYANSLTGVPIQVWTTKAFTAHWTAAADPARPPVTANLTVREGGVLTGTVTNMLPVDEFSDMALVWRGKVFQLLDMPRGVAKSVTVTTGLGLGGPDTGRDFKLWLTDTERTAGAQPYLPKSTGNTRTFDSGTTSNPNFRLWPLLFHEAAKMDEVRGGRPSNVSLRELDQSWRVDAERGEQAVLLLRVPTREGPAEAMTTSPRSPSRLWLGASPTDGQPRPALPGTLRQETYIRVFIPVKTR